jgi:hypothetical protein
MRIPHSYAPTVLRLGLASVFIWFGVSQIMSQGPWVSLVPDAVASMLHLSKNTLVLFNGVAEVIAGTMLAFGILTRWVAILLALHLASISFDLGLNAIAVRDFGLCVATVALFLSENDPLALFPEWPKHEVNIQG